MSIQELYDLVKPFVWVLIIQGISKENIREMRYTAFAVKEHLLMTCSHGHEDWQDWSERTITARPLSSDVVHKAVLVASRRDCDISLFRVTGGKNIKVGTFGSGKLAVGETVMVMVLENPLEFVGSGFVGKVSYPCVENPVFSFDDTSTCDTYVSNAFEITPHHGVVGHVFNKKSIARAEKDPKNSEDVKFSKALIASLPVVQCSGLLCGSGCSGAPMFNVNGEIVGMHVISTWGYEISVHVSVLRRFLDLANTSVGQDGGPSKGEVGQDGGPSKEEVGQDGGPSKGEVGQSSEEKQPFKKPRKSEEKQPSKKPSKSEEKQPFKKPSKSEEK